MKKYLILHADDVGVSHGTNSASIRLLKEGKISSLSIMTPCPWIYESGIQLKSNKNYDVGVHITLNSEWSAYKWAPVSQDSKHTSLVDEFGNFYLTSKETLEHAKTKDIEAEIEAQIKKSIQLGLNISHIDTHMGTVSLRKDWLSAYVNLAEKYSVLPMLVKWSAEVEKYYKLRSFPYEEAKSFLKEKEQSGYFMLDRLITDVGGSSSYEKRFEAYCKAIKSLKPGISQIITHLSTNGEELKAMIGNKERVLRRTWDVKILSDPKIALLLKEENIILTNWRKLRDDSISKES